MEHRNLVPRLAILRLKVRSPFPLAAGDLGPRLGAVMEKEGE